MNRTRMWIGPAAVLSAGAVLPLVAAGQCQTWETTVGSPGAQFGDPFYGTAVRALEIFDDGSGAGLYAAGTFTMMGGNPAHNIARWNGAQWSPVGLGLTSFQSIHATVYDLQAFNDGSGPALYAAGWFDKAGGQPASGVARWNGTSWQSLSSYTNGSLFKMAVLDNGSGPTLYLGGNFYEINGLAQNTLVRWNGQGWQAVAGAPDFSLGGSAIWGFGKFGAVAGQASIFVGGLQLVPGVVINQVQYGTSVFSFGSGGWQYPGYGLQGVQAGGVGSAVMTFEVYDDGSGPRLYAGGLFQESGPTALNHLAKFDGQQWTDVGGGTALPPLTFFTIDYGPTVWDLTQFGGELYLGGGFTQAGGNRALWLASWDGQAFAEPAGGTNDTVYDMQVFDDGSGPSIFVAGRFTKVDPTGANLAAGGIARLSCGTACYADCNGDAGLTVADFGCFQTKFVGGVPYADCDQSGALTVADFGCFQTRFVAGCP